MEGDRCSGNGSAASGYLIFCLLKLRFFVQLDMNTVRKMISGERRAMQIIFDSERTHYVVLYLNSRRKVIIYDSLHSTDLESMVNWFPYNKFTSNIADRIRTTADSNTFRTSLSRRRGTCPGRAELWAADWWLVMWIPSCCLRDEPSSGWKPGSPPIRLARHLPIAGCSSWPAY